jgi:hypothetical protein
MFNKKAVKENILLRDKQMRVGYTQNEEEKYILESLISTNEWETTVFPKEYPHDQGTWRILYIQQRENNYHSVVCWVPRNPGYIIERFLVNIDL